MVGQYHDRLDRERMPRARVAKRRAQQVDILGEEAPVPFGQIDREEIAAAGNEVADGETGELYSCNPYTFDGYWKLPDKKYFNNPVPILDVDKASIVMVVKRSMSPGFAGIANPLYDLDKTLMLFGDAKSFVGEIVRELAGSGHR